MDFKAELWDKMQHIMERYNDHMVHGHIEFDTTLNFELVKKAFTIGLEKVPVFKTIFKANFFRAKWQSIDDLNIDDIVKLVNVDNMAYEKAEAFLVQKLQERKEAQIKVLVVRCNGKDSLNFLQNHMIMDGADFKLFIYLIGDIYSDLVKGGKGNIPFKNGSRSESQLMDDMTEEQKKEINNLVSYSKKTKDKIQFPYEEYDRSKIAPFISKLTIKAETFLKVKANAKKLGVTINDLVVACFYRTIIKFAHVLPGQALGVPCMVDLRRYIKSGESAGACNLTSMMICNLGDNIGETILDTVVNIHANIDELKKFYPGFHGLTLLHKVFGLAPYWVANFLIGTFFKNPLIGISNIGIIDDNKLHFEGAHVDDIFLTGSIKYPPYMQLALSTFRNEITHTIASYGTTEDKNKMQNLLDIYYKEFETFSNAIIK